MMNNEAAEARRDQLVDSVLFHGTTHTMVYGNYIKTSGGAWLTLNLGKAVFFMAGGTPAEQLEELQQISAAINHLVQKMIEEGPQSE